MKGFLINVRRMDMYHFSRRLINDKLENERKRAYQMLQSYSKQKNEQAIRVNNSKEKETLLSRQSNLSESLKDIELKNQTVDLLSSKIKQIGVIPPKEAVFDFLENIEIVQKEKQEETMQMSIDTREIVVEGDVVFVKSSLLKSMFSDHNKDLETKTEVNLFVDDEENSDFNSFILKALMLGGVGLIYVFYKLLNELYNDAKRYKHLRLRRILKNHLWKIVSVSAFSLGLLGLFFMNRSFNNNAVSSILYKINTGQISFNMKSGLSKQSTVSNLLSLSSKGNNLFEITVFDNKSMKLSNFHLSKRGIYDLKLISTLCNEKINKLCII